MPVKIPDEPKADFSTLPWFMRYRWVVVLVLLYPINVLFTLFNVLMAKLRPVTSEKHDSRVKRVQAQIREYAKEKRPLCTDRPGWKMMALRLNLYKSSMKRVQIADMADILSLDKQRMVIRCEPFVTVAQLTAFLAPKGLSVPVVPELDDLTVGGLIMGVGIESSSHRHGLFNDICVSYEVVLADGRLVTATADNEYADLFRALPWSYGTLGMLVAAEVRVIPAGKYVRLEYNPCRTVAEIEKRFAAASNAKDNDFVEALAYSPTHAVVMTGTMASEEDFKKERKSNPRVCVNNIARWYKPWFFTHVREKFSLRPDTVDVEYIPLREYYHRHTRPIFWQMRELVPFGNNLWFRLFLGWVLPIKVSLLKLTTPEAIGKVYEQKFVFQDMLVPLNTLTESLACFHKELSIYPLWLCPFILNKTEPQGFLKPTGDESEMFVDIGAYGMPPVAASDKFNVRQTIRNVEAFVTEKKGYQMLYADTYMTKEEFRVMFDHSNYDKLRTKYAAHDAFPDVFTKVRKQ